MFRLLARSLTVLQLLVVLVLVGCALNPISRAETPEQKYDATLLTYDALLEPALEVLEDPAAPANLRLSIQGAIANTGEIYGAAVKAHADFVAARAAVAAGGPGQVLEVATENLEKWTADLTDSLARLDALVD